MKHISLPLLVVFSSCGILGPADSYRFDVEIQDESYESWHLAPQASIGPFVISGEFEVYKGGSRDITALILEETQYRRFQKRKSYQPLYRKYRATRGKFQITVHEPLDFYFVLDNRFSIVINKWVEGKVQIRKQ